MDKKHLTNSEKWYVISLVSFILSLIALLPYILFFVFGIVDIGSERIVVIIRMLLVLIPLLVLASFAIGVVAIYKVIREKRKGLGYAISGVIISLLIFIIRLYIKLEL